MKSRPARGSLCRSPGCGLERRPVSELAHPLLRVRACVRGGGEERCASEKQKLIQTVDHQLSVTTSPLNPPTPRRAVRHLTGMEGEMQPADEGPCAPKTMCRQQRGPCSTLKPSQSKRSAGKSRSAAAEPPRFGEPFTFHPEQPHPFQLQHHPRLQQLHQSSVATSSSQQHSQAPQPQQHRLPCESRPSSRVPTSTSAAPPLRRAGGAERRFSPDCMYGISTGGCPTSAEGDPCSAPSSFYEHLKQ